MPAAGTFNQTLTDTALGYRALGWSIIPLYGDSDPDRPKVAAVEWSPYQRRRATDAEVATWAAANRFGALGIVTGAVSQLAILDFDDQDLLQAFERACPDLVATRTVITRRGKHLYFHLPPQIVVRSRKLEGIDLLAGGRYAVAPPSIIDGFTYSVGRGGRPRSLSQHDLDQLNHFLDTCAEKPLQTPAARVSTPVSVPQTLTPVESHKPPLDGADLLLLYRGLAGRLGRNAALFQVSCIARDQGWSLAMTVEALADVHAAQPAKRSRRKESLIGRYREAVRTIRSVYTRPPRRLEPKDSNGLYNSLRERLFQLGQTCIVRVWEGLRFAGFKMGQIVSEREVIQALRGIVGRHSIRLALLAVSSKGRPIFKPKSPRTPQNSTAANNIRIVTQTNAFVRESSSDRSLLPPHRPPRRFAIPSLERLSKLLGVQPSGSDPLSLDDLRTPCQTRRAAHRELIRRRPGLYLRQWLSDRLGVSTATLNRYNHAMDGLQVVPTFTQTPIDWWNLRAIPTADLNAGGTFLEDDTGKRWPALKGIAVRLLKRGRAVKLLVQSLNAYAFATAPNGLERQPMLPSRRPPEPAIMTFAQRVERFVRQVGQPPFAPQLGSAPATPPPVPQPLQAWSVAKPQPQPPSVAPQLSDEIVAALASRLYTRINALTADPNRRVSLKTARGWVCRYGERAVYRALALLEHRQGITHPAGFVATVLRSESHFPNRLG